MLQTFRNIQIIGIIVTFSIIQTASSNILCNREIVELIPDAEVTYVPLHFDGTPLFIFIPTSSLKNNSRLAIKISSLGQSFCEEPAYELISGEPKRSVLSAWLSSECKVVYESKESTSLYIPNLLSQIGDLIAPWTFQTHNSRMWKRDTAYKLKSLLPIRIVIESGVSLFYYVIEVRSLCSGIRYCKDKKKTAPINISLQNYSLVGILTPLVPSVLLSVCFAGTVAYYLTLNFSEILRYKLIPFVRSN